MVPIVPVVATAFPTLTARPARQRPQCGRTASQADQIFMGWFARTTEDAMKGTLTEAERMMLARLEATVEAGESFGTEFQRILPTLLPCPGTVADP